MQSYSHGNQVSIKYRETKHIRRLSRHETHNAVQEVSRFMSELNKNMMHCEVATSGGGLVLASKVK